MQQLRLSVFVAELHNRKEEVRRAEEEVKSGDKMAEKRHSDALRLVSVLLILEFTEFKSSHELSVVVEEVLRPFT